MSPSSSRSVLTPARILVAGWLLFVVYAYPGYMSTDSVEQLLQARGAPLQDWHPPMMAWLWRITDHVIAGPFPMLVIQSGTLMVGLFHVLRRAMAPRSAAFVTVAILLFPPVLTQMAVIWKDSQMAGFLAAGLAGLLAGDRRVRLVGCALLVLATADRINAAAATLPIVMLTFEWQPGATRWRRYAIAGAVWIAITVAAFAANRALTEEARHPWHDSVALFDIAGTISHAAVTDAELRVTLAGVPVIPTQDLRKAFRAVYAPTAWWELAHGDARVFDEPSTDEQRQAITRAWWTLLRTHPVAYLAHRARVFVEVLGMSAHDPAGAVWDGFVEIPYQAGVIGHQAQHSAVQARWLAILEGLRASLLFRAWAYLLIALALLPMCRGRLAWTVVSSGLFYELALFFAAPSRDFRYSHWMVLCTAVTFAMVVAGRWRAGRAAASAPAAR